MSELEDETTTRTKPLELAHPYLEIHLLLADGGEHWVQFEQAEFTLARYFQGGEAWRVQLHGEKVDFQSGGPGPLHQGVPVDKATLEVGGCLQLGDHRLWLMDARKSEVARLETCPGPEPGQSWSLKPQAYRIGRRGQTRLNHIEVNHPTVSRAQATLIPISKGDFAILPESESSPTRLNGKLIPTGSLENLRQGDLLQIGEISLRFRQSNQGTPLPTGLRVQSLDGFRLQWRGRTVEEASWKSNKARILMARLALAWDRPLPVESVLEMLWPEQTSLRGRKNLSQCLSELKTTLGLQDEGELLNRTPQSLQIIPSLLVEHDVETFTQLACGQEVSGWSTALNLYKGPFLPGLQDRWVVSKRNELLLLALSVSEQLGRHYLERGQLEEAMACARRGLTWDTCRQKLALLLMQGSIRAGRPEQAIRVFENLREHLHRLHQMEPGPELLRAYIEAGA